MKKEKKKKDFLDRAHDKARSRWGSPAEEPPAGALEAVLRIVRKGKRKALRPR